MLKAAVIGCGWAGRNHASGYATAPDCRLVAVCDSEPARAAQLASEQHVHAYTDIDEMLICEQLDIVSITTKEYAHDGPAIAAMNAGVHVFCEKIMAHSLAAGERMVATARQTGRVLGVNYNYRHVPTFVALRTHLVSGYFGSPVALVAKAHSFCWHHMLDLMCYLLGIPLSVQATLVDYPDKTPYPWHSQHELLYIPSNCVSATFFFAAGAVATIISTMYADFDQAMLDLSLYGEEAAIHLSGINACNVGAEPVSWPCKTTGTTVLPVTLDETFALSLHAFVDAVREARRPPTTGEDGLAIMRLEHAVVCAARAGRVIKLEEIDLCA